MSVKLPPLLVVDDEKNMRLSLEAVMADEGYEVRAVDSAQQALRLLEQEDFFMIISDARLNGMSRLEFLRPVKQKESHLRGDSRNVARKRVVWPRKGRVYRRVETEGGTRRRGRWRDHFPRRNRRHEPPAAGQAAAFFGGWHLHACRRQPGIARRCPAHRRDESRHYRRHPPELFP